MGTIHDFSRALEDLDVSVKKVNASMEKLSAYRKRSINELDNLFENPLFQNWLELAAIDANHPDLKLHERLIRRFVRIDTGIFAELRRLFRDAQIAKRRRTGDRTRLGSALDWGEVEALMDEYRGAA